ncbi:hypothetical protein GCM10009730_54020 [Streptomyces albidochromogenes]|uniref:hypothetical protein n=1 Tax=Streptomyces albidochromogenes TaxID=329524 RepID=UPI00110FE76D|nr:hypothetical protein [Streptomyces albidochromogenes]
MPQVSPRRRGAATVSALLGTVLAVLVLLLCTDTGGGGVPGTGGPVRASGEVTAPAAAPALGPASASTAVPASAGFTAASFSASGDDDPEPGCRQRHPGPASVPVAPPRGGAAYELPATLCAARAGGGAWGAEDLVPHRAPGHLPPPLDPPTPEDLSILRV